MKHRLLALIATMALLLTACTTKPASKTVDPQGSPDTTIPTWRVGDEGELKRVIIQKRGGDPLECVVYVDHGYREPAGGLSCNWSNNQ